MRNLQFEPCKGLVQMWHSSEKRMTWNGDNQWLEQKPGWNAIWVTSSSRLRNSQFSQVSTLLEMFAQKELNDR
jgi:hypothetical protein